MAANEHDEVTLGLTAAALDGISQGEAELVPVLGADLLARPRGDGALGFGEAEITWLLAALPVASVVSDILLGGAKDAASELVKDGILATVRRLRARSGTTEPTDDGTSDGVPPAVPPDLVERARAGAFTHACSVGLDAERARTLADALAGSLTAASRTAP